METGVKRREKTEKTKRIWSLSFTSVNFFYLSSSPDLQTIFIAPRKCSEWKKKKNHIQVNDRRHTTGDMTSEWSIKCPLGSMVLEKGERNKNIKKKNTFFFFVRNVLLYIQWQSQLFSQTPAHTHSFILVLLISNTSVKCNTYIYLYIMKELKRFFFSKNNLQHYEQQQAWEY